ncbi:unnamed protein product [Amoebophrya sp. A25]|nr:unnamed protein product [Amoebophrya sp. A25]|eukprot:GSA25T00015185001.1
MLYPNQQIFGWRMIDLECIPLCLHHSPNQKSQKRLLVLLSSFMRLLVASRCTVIHDHLLSDLVSSCLVLKPGASPGPRTQQTLTTQPQHIMNVNMCFL